MGADLVPAPTPRAHVAPLAGRACFWPAWIESADRAGATLQPGFVVIHHDAGGELRLHRLLADSNLFEAGGNVDPAALPIGQTPGQGATGRAVGAVGHTEALPTADQPAGARFSLFLASRADDLASARVLAAENAWEHLGSELLESGRRPAFLTGGYAVALYRGPRRDGRRSALLL